MSSISRTVTVAGLLSILLASSLPAQAADPITIRISMPTLTCNKGVLEPNECILNGTLRARGPESLNGPVRYYCDLKYTYVAAGNAQQAIRFSGRTLFHGEVQLKEGRATEELSRPLTLKLSNQPRQVEVADIGCEQELGRPVPAP